jgi:hypothetical protein
MVYAHQNHSTLIIPHPNPHKVFYLTFTLYKGIKVNNPRLLSIEEYKIIKEK